MHLRHSHLQAFLVASLILLAGPLSTAARGEGNSFCPADLTGPDIDLPDGLVGVPDLLLMLFIWGNTAPPRPRADLAPPPNGDGTVDVADLIELLSNWGECFPSTAIDRCVDAIHPDSLEAKITTDGDYPFFINGILDGPRRGPTNNANEIFAGPTTFGWAFFGAQVPDGFLYHDIFGFYPILGTEGGDIWFHYTASCDGIAQFTTESPCGSENLRDTLIDVYPGDACPDSWLDIIASDDDSAPDTCSPHFSRVWLSVQAGESYLIRIGGWGGEKGHASLNVSCIDN